MGEVFLDMIAQLLVDTLAVSPTWARRWTWTLITLALLAVGATLVMIFG